MLTEREMRVTWGFLVLLVVAVTWIVVQQFEIRGMGKPMFAGIVVAAALLTE